MKSFCFVCLFHFDEKKMGQQKPQSTVLAVVGSRTVTNYNEVLPYLQHYLSIPNLHLVSGGAIGADRLGRRFAQEHHLSLQEFLPDWKQFGKSAGFRRNHDIISAATEVIAFWDGKSKGTKHSIDLARKQGKACRVILV
jgi:predicted Rossmann fold nucleotide-binding protein DprA/Smf involved in DNA uptake